MKPKLQTVLIVTILSFFLNGCADLGRKCADVCSPDVKIISYHVKKHYENIRTLAQRLYARNPCYEPDPDVRMAKIQAVFGEKSTYPVPASIRLPMSHELLTLAFSNNPPISDRVLILILGLKKGIDEAYDTGSGPFITGCQIDARRLERLYKNISQVNWRLKTYKSATGTPLFFTNQALESGYINMGFEVIMTQMLTRIQDDIYLRGGLEGNLTFRIGALFLSIL